MNLIRPYEDRTIIRHEVICYVDSNTIKLFSASIKGEMLHEISGEGYPAMRVATLLPTKKSVASCFEEGVNESEQNGIWKEFAEWVNTMEQAP